VALARSSYRCALALAAAACCVLFIAPASVAAAPGPDTSTLVAPEARSIHEQVKLANDYLAGHRVQQDLKMAAYWYEKAAAAGDPGAEFEIGYFYETGTGVEKNPERALHWYQLAASVGMPDAKVALGIVYLWGIGVPKNQGVAFALFNEAAAHGNGRADCFLGDLYAFGMGVPQDSSKAEQWYRRGASLHDPIAELDLALKLMSAEGSRQHLPTAAKLLRASATAGYVPAKHALGQLLVNSPNLAKSPVEAAEQLKEAADAGDWKSSAILGVLARDGKAVARDDQAAYYHFRVAVLQGGEDANHLLASDLRLLSANLGSDRVRTLDLQAKEWYRQHHFVLDFVKTKEGRFGFPSFPLVSPSPDTHTGHMLVPATN
jgi:TPR repeat protein